MSAAALLGYLDGCKDLVYRELQRIVPKGPLSSVLYDRMLDYPRRSAKSLRPALCIATCRALGGGLEAVLPTAAVLELYHNAFLVHDDIEDGSELRRDLPTLHTEFGVPVAINVGDAMLALALSPLLENTRTVGLGPALRVLRHVAEMACVTAEGQALELEWTRTCRLDLSDDDYFDMVERKTSHYSFVTPLLLGAVLSGTRTDRTDVLRAFGRDLGLAFQIQDDILNLTEDYGKERDGDLYEGKYTLILLHMLRSATPEERHAAATILSKPRRRPWQEDRAPIVIVRDAIAALGTTLPTGASETLLRACDDAERGLTGECKTPEDVAVLKGLAIKYGSLAHAQAAADRFAKSASGHFENLKTSLTRSIETDFLGNVVTYVVERRR